MPLLIGILAGLLLSAPASPSGQAPPGPMDIDVSHSHLTVWAYKTGLFSAFAHNHEISAPIESGKVQLSENPSVELHIDARKLRVLDLDTSDDTRAQIQKTMLGPEVLDSDRFPEIHFQSTGVEAAGTNRWLMRGNLDLHGQTHPVIVDVTLKDGAYQGSATLQQTAFGIKPVNAAGGAIKIKDEIKIEFEISLVK